MSTHVQKTADGATFLLTTEASTDFAGFGTIIGVYPDRVP